MARSSGMAELHRSIKVNQIRLGFLWFLQKGFNGKMVVGQFLF